MDKKRMGHGKLLLLGLALGVGLTGFAVLASGFMVETTNTDTFCVSCHAMQPFRSAWQGSRHGGSNPQGFAAQCVDCHLPHGNFLQYLTAKAITGSSHIYHNLTSDPARHPWGASAERRLHYTYDSACRRCHHQLVGPGLAKGGILAHRSYLRGAAGKNCVGCHPHVGHQAMRETARRFFGQES